ncbi:MAG: CobD/CbiB family protein [Betaproteobacteria bacterium]|nr:CobD/CbiB family protein [Betaproteobacteria bacterium]MBI2960683.1 CobD/CbiB family protein [Betaproteobacteria bacterium]
MGLVSLIFALVLEQWRPLADRRQLFAPVEGYAGFFERQFNAGEIRHGRIAWLLAVLPAAAGSWLLYALLLRASPLLALAFNVAVLYLTMGFRQFSHYFTGIQLALQHDDLPRAQELLAQWRGHPCTDQPREEVVKLAIEEALVASHRRVFAVIFWFVLLPGPSGAVLYRFADYLGRRWGESDAAEMSGFGRFAKQAFDAIEWLPARFTAASFAVVGDFEDAIFCWRAQAAKWPDQALGIVLAAGAGAIGVRLGNPLAREGVVLDRPELGLGEEADAGFLDSTVGLVWRALVLWLLMLLLLGIASAVS